MVDAKKIEELRGLLAKATPGPWKNHLVDDTTIVASNGFEIGTTWPGGSVYNGFVDPAEQHEINAALIVAMRNALPALLDLAPKALATLSLAGEDARPEDRAEQFIQAAVDSAPEPLRRLGEWLANKLDDDDWKTAERLLNGASVEARSLSLRVEAEKRAREEAALEHREEELRDDARLGAALARAEAAETHSAALAGALEEAKGVWKPISALWSKPAECGKGCPPRQVCDFCQRELFLGWNGDYVELWNTTNYYLCRERSEPHWKHMAEEAARLTHFMAFDMPDRASSLLAPKEDTNA